MKARAKDIDLEERSFDQRVELVRSSMSAKVKKRPSLAALLYLLRPSSSANGKKRPPMAALFNYCP